MAERMFIEDTQDLGVILKKAVADMPDAPSVRIFESDGGWRMSGAGIEFSAEVFPGHVRVTRHGVNESDLPDYVMQIKGFSGQRSARLEEGNLVVHSTNCIEDVYNTMSAIFTAEKRIQSRNEYARRSRVYNELDKLFE